VRDRHLLAGIVFAVLFVVGAGLFDSAPGTDDSDAKIRAFYSDHGNQVKLQVAYLVLTAAGIAFLWFVGALYERLRVAEGDSGRLSAVILVSGAAFAVLMLAGYAAGDMAAATSDHIDRFEADPSTVRLLSDVAYALAFETALPLVAPMVLAVSLIAFRSGVLPRWLAWSGVVVAVACLFGFLGIPMGLFLVWIAVVAIVPMRPQAPAAET
jgi:hypothetical protein